MTALFRRIRAVRDSRPSVTAGLGMGEAARSAEDESAASSTSTRARYEQVVARMLFSSDAERFTLVVTSAVCGEGVTTTCVGVARALAASTSKKVVLVDTNLRKPALHEALGIPRDPGFSDLIFEPAGTELPNLYVIPGGPPVENPTQLVTSRAARTALRMLSSQYDYVIVDCPPLLATVDAASICRVASGVLIVVRAGVTPREDVVKARERVGEMPVLGVLLTGVEP